MARSRCASPTRHLPPLLPEIVLAPLLAFDGLYIGWATAPDLLTQLSPQSRPAAADRFGPGTAFPARRSTHVPVDATDVRLDLVVTEAGCRSLAASETGAMRILFVGHAVGRSGRAVLLAELPRLRTSLALDAVIVNAENAAGGYGLTAAIAAEFLDAGADVLTMGNHVWTSAS